MYRTVRFERHLSGGSLPVKRFFRSDVRIDAMRKQNAPHHNAALSGRAYLTRGVDVA
jgi:hypothetical protein